MRDQEAPRPIPSGPPGVPREGNPSSWKEQDNSWRSPFKGQFMLFQAGHSLLFVLAIPHCLHRAWQLSMYNAISEALLREAVAQRSG